MSRDNYIERQTLSSRYADVAAEYRAEGFEIVGWRPHSIIEDHEGFDIWHKQDDEAPADAERTKVSSEPRNTIEQEQPQSPAKGDAS